MKDKEAFIQKGDANMMTVLMIAKEILLAILEKYTGCTAIGLDIATDAQSSWNMKAKDGSINPYWKKGAKKHSTLAGKLGASYENCVNNQLGREDKEMNAEAKTPVWFAYVEGSRIIGFNYKNPSDKRYFAIQVTSVSDVTYRDALGNVIPFDTIAKFIPEHTSSSTQADVEKKIIWNTIGFDSVKAMRVGGRELIIVPNASVECEANAVEAFAEGTRVTAKEAKPVMQD